MVFEIEKVQLGLKFFVSLLTMFIPKHQFLVHKTSRLMVPISH